jgi:hypothetical protein
MNDEITQSVAYDNYDDFQHINAMFSQKKFISLFLGLFNDETNLRVRYYFSRENENTYHQPLAILVAWSAVPHQLQTHHFSRENENTYHQHSNSCSFIFFI